MYRLKKKIGKYGVFILAVSLTFTAATAATTAADKLTPEMQARLAKMSPEGRQMILSYTPELRQKFFALSPELRATLGKLHASHTRHSKELTLRQVMQEILSEYQGIAAAVATDNAEQAADSARRLANHRIPAGGLLPYFPLDKINDESLSLLPAMNDAVEGAALRLAEAADMGKPCSMRMPGCRSRFARPMTEPIKSGRRGRSSTRPGTSPRRPPNTDHRRDR